MTLRDQMAKEIRDALTAGCVEKPDFPERLANLLLTIPGMSAPMMPPIADDLIDELLTTAVGNIVPVPVSPEWLPIESAPKDGTEFVMMDAHVKTATVGAWMADVGWRNIGKKPGEALAVPSWFPLATPTHWMPLPEPPASVDGRRMAETENTGSGR